MLFHKSIVNSRNSHVEPGDSLTPPLGYVLLMPLLKLAFDATGVFATPSDPSGRRVYFRTLLPNQEQPTLSFQARRRPLFKLSMLVVLIALNLSFAPFS